MTPIAQMEPKVFSSWIVYSLAALFLGCAFVAICYALNETNQRKITLEAVELVNNELRTNPLYSSLSVDPHSSKAIVVSGSVANTNIMYQLQQQIAAMRLPRGTFAHLHTGEVEKTTQFVKWQVQSARP